MYIRFKDIPENDISGVYDGDLGKIRNEKGVSCYRATKNDYYQIVLPGLSEGVLYDLLSFIEDAKNGEIPIYLVEGNYIGKGSYGEPLIKNIYIVDELEIVELAEHNPKFKMDKTNLQFKIKKIKTTC